MIKADAYGHGAVGIAKALVKEHIDYLAVALLEEAVELREAGINAPILVLGTADGDNADLIVRYRLTQSIYTVEIAGALSAAALRQGTKAVVHVKIDTGMNRQGVTKDKAEDYARALSGLEGLHVEGGYSHFSEADNPDTSFSKVQFARFRDALEAMARHGIVPEIAHIANSAAILHMPESSLDMVRPGILLYGLSPGGRSSLPDGFHPVMRLCSTIANIRVIEAGESVSYGRTFTATRRTRVALLPIGYADGYPRIVSNRAEALVRSRRAPLLGRICMDQCMIDVTDIPEAEVGDEAVLFGAPDLPLSELSALAQTIDYEITCGISGRVPRVFRECGK